MLATHRELVKLNVLSDLHLSLGALEIPRNDADAGILLGAHGALIGMRFYASAEALGDWAKRRIVAARGDEMARTQAEAQLRLGTKRTRQHENRAS